MAATSAAEPAAGTGEGEEREGRRGARASRGSFPVQTTADSTRPADSARARAAAVPAAAGTAGEARVSAATAASYSGSDHQRRRGAGHREGRWPPAPRPAGWPVPASTSRPSSTAAVPSGRAPRRAPSPSRAGAPRPPGCSGRTSAPALHGDVVVRGHEEDAVEPVGLADHHEPAHEVAQQSQAGVLLAGEPRAPLGKGLPRVLQEQPLDGDDLHARDGAAAAVGAQLDEQLSLARAVLRQDAQRVPGALARRAPRMCWLARGKLHAERAEPPGPELREDARPLEEQLDAVAREVAEEARGARGPRQEPGEVLLAQREGQPVVDGLRGAQVPAQAAEASQGQRSSSMGSISRPDASHSRYRAL